MGYTYSPNRIWYKDPDVDAVEHMAQAAWHLCEAGLYDQADDVIRRIAAKFETVPMHPRKACKQSGKVEYWPSGIIRMDVPEIQDMPAPPYEASRRSDEEKARAAMRTLRETAADTCANLHYGWFPQKQVVAAVTGKKLQVPNFRPAKTLNAIATVCAAYRPGMDGPAAAVLADKLRAALEKDPLTTSSYSGDGVHRELTEATGDYYNRNSEFALLWFEEKTLTDIAEAIKVMASAKRPTTYSEALAAIRPNRVKWRIGYSASGSVRSAIEDRIEEGYRTLRDDPSASRYLRPPSDMCSLAMDAIDAAFHVDVLQRAHLALSSATEYLSAQLASARVLDPDYVHDPDLPLKAAAILLADRRAGLDDDLYGLAVRTATDYLATDKFKACLVDPENAPVTLETR